MASIRLLGRISVQLASIHSRHSFFLPFGPTIVQPAGTSRKPGHRQYWPSWFTSTRNSPFSLSNGFVIFNHLSSIFFLTAEMQVSWPRLPPVILLFTSLFQAGHSRFFR